jgi:hypothetical protein
MIGLQARLRTPAKMLKGGPAIPGIIVIDFDRTETWYPQLRAAFSSIVTDQALSTLSQSNPTYVEDARDDLFRLTVRNDVIDRTLEWLRSSTIAGYHGTRLTNEEVASVRVSGLSPLDAFARRERLVRALSPHSNWPTAEKRLDAVLKELGPNNRAGRREGQAHLSERG